MARLNRFLACLAIVAAFGFALGTPAAKAEEAKASVLVQMFDWWNEAFKDENGFTREAFGRYFTEDGAIMINGKVAVKGLDDLVTHFRAIQKRADYVELVTPFEEEFTSASGDKIFTYHFIKSRHNGEEGLMHAMGYADIENGKIKLIHLVRAEEPKGDKAKSAN